MVKYKWKLYHTYIKSGYGYKWQTVLYSLIFFYRFLNGPSLFRANPSSGWWSSQTHHPPEKIPFMGAWICWLEPNKGGECSIQLLEEVMLHGHTIWCLHPRYISWWSWPLFHVNGLGFDPWVWMNFQIHQHWQNNYPHPWS